QVMRLNDADVLSDGYFDVQAANDTNRVDLFVFASDTQALLMARLDNLGKGASGAAVQSRNLHLGVEEDAGLTVGGTAGSRARNWGSTPGRRSRGCSPATTVI